MESSIEQLRFIADEMDALRQQGDHDNRLAALSHQLKAMAEKLGGMICTEPGEHSPLAHFAANAPGYFFTLTLSPEGNWSLPFASEGIRNVFGLEPETVVQDVWALISLSHPDDHEITISKALASARDLTPYHVEYRIRHPHKGERWIECSSLPKRQPDGGTRWNGFMHDITNRKRTENTLRFLARHEDSPHSQSFLAALARHLGQTLGVDYVAVNCATDQPGIAETAALYAKGDIVPNIRLPLAGTPCADVMGKELCCHPQDVQTLFPDSPLVAEMGVESYAGIPLWDSAGRAMGVLAVLHGKPMADPEMVTQLLQLVTPSVEAILDRERSEHALRESERQFRTLAENLPDNMARWDCEGHFLYVNPTHARLLGKSVDELVGTPIRSQILPEVLKVAKTGIPRRIPHHLVPDPKGEVRIHEIDLIPERNELGEVVSVLGLGRDVTGHVRMQEALVDSERQFRSLAKNLPNNVARYTTDARLIYANPTLERTMGKHQAEAWGETPADRWPNGEMDDYQAAIQEVGRTGKAARLEKYLPYASGQFAWFLCQFVAERDESGTIVSVLVISDDITDRKRAEADMRLVANVFEASSEGILITDLDGNILKANPASARITGFDIDRLIGKNPFQIDAGCHGEAFYAAIRATLHAHGAWSGEIDNRRSSGELFTMRTSIAAVHDNRGAVVQYVVIFSDISQLKQHELQLQYIAHHDTLTGLPNRILLIDRLQQGIAQMRRSGEMLAVLFIDLDGFKPINDKLGHQTGDQTLVEMGKRMIDTLRATDTVSRIGGDEFIILLPGLSDVSECELSTRRLLKAIAEPIDIAGYRFTLSASIGIAVYPNDADDADTLLRCADEAMYTAKRTGRSQYVFCSHDVRHGFRFDGSSVHDLRLALEQDQIEVHYQPIVDFATGQVVKAEALVRWRHPERGLVPPGEFISMAEETGLIHAIGTRVFSKALDTAQAWHRLCPNDKPHRISVNRSPREFLDPEGVDSWMNLLRQKGVALGHMLSVEITEGLLLDDRPKVLEQLKQLRSVGMTIALDDFGTGFSSLAYLKKFAIDYLKIDRSFVLDIEHDPSDRVIVESVIAMARHLGIRLIAEGVENQAQAELLASARCHYAQGYLYSRPLPEAEFLAFVAQTRERPLPVPHRLEVSAA